MNLLTHSLDTVSHGVRTGNKPESKTHVISHARNVTVWWIAFLSCGVSWLAILTRGFLFLF
jgi:hypothetical protein